MSAAGMEFVAPMGLIDDDGNLVPLPKDEVGNKEATQTTEALFQGMQEKIPRHVGQLVSHRGRSHERVVTLSSGPADDKLRRTHTDTAPGLNTAWQFANRSPFELEFTFVIPRTFYTEGRKAVEVFPV